MLIHVLVKALYKYEILILKKKFHCLDIQVKKRKRTQDLFLFTVS